MHVDRVARKMRTIVGGLELMRMGTTTWMMISFAGATLA
jgi:hypothetical protein